MTEETPITASPKTFNLIELNNYIIDFQVIQLPAKPWVFSLHIFPQSEEGLIEENDHVEGMGIAHKIKDVNTVIIYSRESYSQWEYAAESALDIIETLGFTIDENNHHAFRVVFWDEATQQAQPKTAIFKDNEVRLVKDEQV